MICFIEPERKAPCLWSSGTSDRRLENHFGFPHRYSTRKAYQEYQEDYGIHSSDDLVNRNTSSYITTKKGVTD